MQVLSAAVPNRRTVRTAVACAACSSRADSSSACLYGVRPSLPNKSCSPLHPSGAWQPVGPGLEIPAADAIWDLLELRITTFRVTEPASRRMFLSPLMLYMSIFRRSGGFDADPASVRTICQPSVGTARDHGGFRRGAPRRRSDDALARMEQPGGARDRAPLRPGEDRHSRGRMAVLRALRQGDQRAQTGTQRGHPGAQLPDAGDSTIASPISSAIYSNSRARRPRSTPTSSSSAACISWPRHRRSSIRTRPC